MTELTVPMKGIAVAEPKQPILAKLIMESTEVPRTRSQRMADMLYRESGQELLALITALFALPWAIGGHLALQGELVGGGLFLMLSTAAGSVLSTLAAVKIPEGRRVRRIKTALPRWLKDTYGLTLLSEDYYTGYDGLIVWDQLGRIANTIAVRGALYQGGWRFLTEDGTELRARIVRSESGELSLREVAPEGTTESNPIPTLVEKAALGAGLEMN